MSYILDALRRADSERERGAIPGIHAQPVPPHWRDARRGARVMKPWVGAVIGLSVVVLGAFAWHLMGREAPPEVARSALPPTPSPVTPAPATPAPAPAMPPATAAPAPAPSPPAAAAVAVAPAAPPTKIAERPRVPASPSAEPAKRKPAAPAAAPAEPSTQRAATNGALPGGDARVYALSELPQDIRRQLPSLTIGGSMYSETPSSRMLIVNGQLVHEGDALAPGLSLEQIKLKSAILRFKGYRYEISY